MPELPRTVFSATWGLALKAMTVFFLVLFAGVVAVMCSPLGPDIAWVRLSILAVPVVVALVSALFMVRGYTLSGHTLGIQRLCWTTAFDLTRLVSAEADSEALHASIRVFGNGGLFAFTGWYRNKKLGVYRAYVTDARRTVVLRFADQTVVVTPDEPEKFVVAVKSLISIPES